MKLFIRNLVKRKEKNKLVSSITRPVSYLLKLRFMLSEINLFDDNYPGSNRMCPTVRPANSTPDQL